LGGREATDEVRSGWQSCNTDKTNDPNDRENAVYLDHFRFFAGIREVKYVMRRKAERRICVNSAFRT
jgi:hypothetical protein